jgi:hypothetical protein
MIPINSQRYPSLKIYVPYYIELHLRKLHPFWVTCSNFGMHQKQNTNMVENKSNIIPKQDHTNREVIIFDFHSAQKHKFVDAA